MVVEDNFQVQTEVDVNDERFAVEADVVVDDCYSARVVR